MSNSNNIDEILDQVEVNEEDFRKILKEATNLDDESIERVAEAIESNRTKPIAIDSDQAVAPSDVKLPDRYKASEGSLSDDPIWAEHLKSHWGF